MRIGIASRDVTPPPHAPLAGYEPTSSRLAPGAGESMVEQAIDLLDQLYRAS
jgi:hypothetical protein